MDNFLVYVAVISVLFWAYNAEEVQKCDELKSKCYCINSTVDCSCRDISNWLTMGHLRMLDACKFTSINFSHINQKFMPKFPPLSIEVLDLSHNQIARFHPYAFADMETLTVLDLSYNHLKIRFVVLSKMEKLRELNLESNKIPSLGIRFHEKAPNLEKINLSHNPLNGSALVLLSGLTKLKHVDLSHTNIEKLPKEFFDNLNQLNYLDLTGNNFKTIVAALPANQHFSLKTLLLDGNPITELGNDKNNFPDFSALEALSLSHMPELEAVKNSPFEKLQNLTTLYLARNPRLSNIRCSVFMNGTGFVLPRLEELHFNNLSLRESYIRLNLTSDSRICDQSIYILESEIFVVSLASILPILLCVLLILFVVVLRKRRQNRLNQRYNQPEEKEAFRKYSQSIGK